MNLERWIRRLADAAEDASALPVAGEMLGNALAGNRLELLRSARAALARQPVPSGSYTAGYFAALAEVTAAYEAAIGPAQEAIESSELLITSGARDALVAMREGLELPTEIASRINRSADAVSRLLNKLRAAGLAEQYEPPLQADQRLRPHRLTGRGERVVDALPASLSEDALRAIQFTIRGFAKLARTRSATVSAIGEVAESAFRSALPAKAAAEAFADAARAEGIVAGNGDLLSLLPTRADEQARLVDYLQQAVVASKSYLMERLMSYATSGIKIVVRSSSLRSKEWRVLLSTKGETWDKYMLVVCPELDLQEIDTLQPFVWVYDDPQQLDNDALDARFAGLNAAAKGRICVAATNAKLPASVEHLAVA